MMRAFCLLIALAVSSCSLAAETEMAQRRHHLRMKNRRVNRYLTTDEYRLMRAPKIVNGMKKTRIGSRVVDRDGITVQVGDDGKIGVNVDVTVNVNVGTDGGDGNSDETGEPECIEWETSYILASSKSSKSAGKSGKGSKGGKSSKSAGKSGKSTEVIPIRKCVAYATKNPSKSPTMEPVPIVTPNPTEVLLTPAPVDQTSSPVAQVRPTPIPTMMNITPDPTDESAPASTPSPNEGVTPSPTEVDATGAPVTPVTPSPSSTGSIIPETGTPAAVSSFPSPAGDVSLPPVTSAPPQIGSLPTLPPALSVPPVLPTSLPPQTAGNLPTLPPGTQPILPTLPPQSGPVPTLPPALSVPPVLPTSLPPQASGNLPTLPPGTQPILPTLPPQSGPVPTLPPGLSAPPILPTLPPALSTPPVLPTLPPQAGSLPTLPPGTFESLVPSVANIGQLSWDFENGVFPEPPWTTEGVGVWAIDQTQVVDGLYSIKSPDLETGYVDGTGTLVSNATLTLDDSFGGGVLKFKVLASVQPPRDIFVVYIDGEDAVQLVNTPEFTEVPLGLSPGPHVINFSYQYNPLSLPELPESPDGRLGVTWVDSVIIESSTSVPAPTVNIPTLPPGTSLPPATPTNPPMNGDFVSASPVLSSLSPAVSSFAPSVATPVPTIASIISSSVPTIANDTTSSSVPTIANVTTSSSVPTITNTTTSSVPTYGATSPPLASFPPVSSGLSFAPPRDGWAPTPVPTVLIPSASSNDTDIMSPSPSTNEFTRLSWDFEDGVFPASPWSTAGDGIWSIDQSETDMKYSIKSPDLEISMSENSPLPRLSNATLTLNDDFIGGFLKLRVHTSVQLPKDVFVIYIDDESAAQYDDTQGWTDVALGVAPGPHMINFVYQYNPFGVDPLSASPVGAVWIDNVVIESLPPAERDIDNSVVDMSSFVPSQVPSKLDDSFSPGGDFGTDDAPTVSPSYYPSYIPTQNPISERNEQSGPTESPTFYPSYAPTYVPTSN